MMTVPLDDFDVILGMDFMLLANAMDTYLQDSVRSAEKKDSLMSAMQPGPRPPAQAPYSMAPAELTELRKQFDMLLEDRMIQPSKLPYGSPVLFRRKQDGSMRMCMDYQALDKVTTKNKYPIPNTIDLFDKLTKAKFDMRNRFKVRVLASSYS
ncbi:UNVERIFIED_CONTAM: RNA-directed DNA polymerase [Sesamum angustifolium]|uniref:RNA-directed DNA polymerase n=1 Tax=Sesamum angustifolium TaxID=2727405 RepID=A0AAW2IKX8_9LAMI